MEGGHRGLACSLVSTTLYLTGSLVEIIVNEHIGVLPKAIEKATYGK